LDWNWVFQVGLEVRDSVTVVGELQTRTTRASWLGSTGYALISTEQTLGYYSDLTALEKKVGRVVVFLYAEVRQCPSRKRAA
jgi:hypothetical protein